VRRLTSTAAGLHKRKTQTKRVAAVAALLGIVGCGSPGRTIDQAFEAATSKLRRGELTEALGDAERGLALAANEQERWKFQFLRAEILLSKPDLSQAQPILGQPLPGQPEFAG